MCINGKDVYHMLISDKQHQANRRSALLSTGPVTKEGKAAVRLNALRHGLRARTILLPGEDPAEYQQLCDDLESDWQPQNRTQQLLVEQMAVAQWKLARLEVGERGIFAQQMPAERQMALLDRFSTQRSRLERSFSKAMSELRQLQRPGEIRRKQAVTETRQPVTQPPAPAPDSAGEPWSQAVPQLVMAPVAT
jgi:hypothetical protein